MNIDKSQWLDGPWRDEPDIAEWVDEGSRLPCLVLRHPQLGSLCGYVGVPPDHPAYGYHYDGITMEDAEKRQRRWDAMMEMERDVRAKGLSFEEALHVSYRKISEDGWEPQVNDVGECLLHARVHGGLTFAGRRPDEVEDGFWYFGFDCGHAGDLTGFSSPIASVMKGLMSGTYRDMAYVKNECASLARFLASIRRE